jgi:hypothetical protein
MGADNADQQNLNARRLPPAGVIAHGGGLI